MKGQVEEQQQLSQQQVIRRHGYELTPASAFILPTASNPTSLIKSLLHAFREDDRQKAIFNPQSPKLISVLNDKQAIIYHSNKLTVVKYSMKEEGFSLQSKACFLLNQHIKRVVCGFVEHRQEKSDIFDHFAVQYEDSTVISLFRVDHQTATLSHDLKENDRIFAMRFVSSNELVTVLANGRVNGYSIREGRLRKAKGNLKILLQDDQSLINGELCTSGRGNQAKILLFYLVHSRKHQKYQLHLKEYVHEGAGQLQQLGTFYDAFDSQALSGLIEGMTIFCFKQGILIHQGLTVNVLQKRFGKYTRSDVISQLSAAKRIAVIKKGQHVFICSFGEEVELWEVVMKEIGCSLKLLDVIEADGEFLAKKLIKAWIFVQGKKPEFVMAVDAGPRQVHFFLTKKLDKLAKLTGRVRREELRLQGIQQRGQKSAFALRLRQMQQLGGKLGFRRREFYLKLWRQSQKNYAHIAQFLLACKDFKVIFNELSLFLRVKKLTVTEIIRILKRIEQSLLEELTHSLELELLRQFLKTNFQRRKLKLYSGEVQLDFQQYQDIYETSLLDMLQRSIDLHLFPDKFKHDILWKEQTQEKPIEIPYILREFRLLILEDYPGFLLKLLQPYGEHLSVVVQAYPYLLPQFPLKISVIREQLVMLSNIYEAEKIQEQQYSWLGYIRENEWQREASSLDFLHRHLFAHHPTSLIADKLRQFTEGPWCHRHKYSRHVLLQARRQEFEEKLPAISDGSSFLFLCEWGNRLALQSGGKSDSTALVQVMHRHNHLPLQEYYRYKLYCTLHYMLIQQQLLHTPTTIIELMQLAPEKLVACFFLGNRERIALLFQQVSKEYPSRGAFNSMIQAFVGSGECSKVELEMLTNYLRRAGEQYQQESQELIGIVLRGFLKRIEVRQKDKALDFLELFRSISLTESLLITLALFETVKADCTPILKLFDLSSLTYDTVIHDPRTVITSITHEYFSNSGVRLRSIYIQGREVSLSFPQNLFVVVLYLKDKIYSYGEEMQLYLIFCEAVLGWNQFDLLRDCFSQDILIDDQEYLPEEFTALVVDYMLNKYYEDETLLYCTETTDHIHQLLSLIDDTAPIAVVQLAKIDFVRALEPLGQSIGVQYMEMVRQQWEKEEEREGLFRDIVDLFPIIEWVVAVELYSCLQRMRTERVRVQVKSDEFVQMALYICGKYIKEGEFQRICEVISFLNAGEVYYRAKYSFMIECFLQVLHDRLQNPHHIRHSYLKVDKQAELANCKRPIDYFLSHFSHIDSITDFFASKFELPPGDIPDEIEVDSQLCIPSGSLQWISREALWELILKRTISSSESFTRREVGGRRGHQDAGSNALDTRTILFTYCFVCNVLHDTHYLFELDDISFRHLENVQVLTELAKQETLKIAINFKSLYRQYLKGLFKMYVLLCDVVGGSSPQQEEIPVLQKRVSMDDDVKIREIRNMEDSKLILLVADLPMEKGELELVKAMKKLSVLFQNASVPIQEKPVRMTTVKTIPELSQHSLPLYFQAQGNLKESVTQLHLGLPSQHLQVRTFRFLQFEKVKRQIASKTSMVSEKLIIGKVLDELENCHPQMQLQMNTGDMEEEESFLEEKITINKMMPPREWEEEEIGHVLEEMELQKSQEMIALDLSGIHSPEHDQNQVDSIRQLLEIKDYHKIMEEFPTKAILRAIDAEFYQRGGSSAPRPKKRIMRSNTLKESILNSKLIALLEALDGLKLYGNSAKARLLRSCLTTISSQELQSVEGFLLGVFKLNVLLDVSKNTHNLVKAILEHARESCTGIPLPKFKIVVKIIESFIRKCREEARAAKHSSKTLPNGHEVGELYCEYLIRMAGGERPQEQKQRQLAQVMNVLTKEDLLAIHQRLSSSLSEGDLYIPYLQLIHSIYVGD